MGSKKSRKRTPAAPAASTPVAGKGPPWLFIATAVVAVAAVGVFTLSRGDDTAEPRTAASPTAEDSSAALASETAPVAPVSTARAPDAPVPEMPATLDDLPMPPLPYVPQMVPRPPELVRRAYVFAAQNPGVLSYVPCYCGCENDGHVSNVDCFVGSRAPSGAVESWDTHGMT